jgi:hypothetical protein
VPEASGKLYARRHSAASAKVASIPKNLKILPEFLPENPRSLTLLC